MKPYSFYDPATGELHKAQIVASASHLELNTPPGYLAIEGHHDRFARRVDLATGQVVAWQPGKPPDDADNTFAWDPTIERWRPIPTIASRRRMAWLRIKDKREAADNATLPVQSIGQTGVTVDASPRAILAMAVQTLSAVIARLTGPAAAAAWTANWTLADNSIVAINAQQMANMCNALRDRLEANHTRSETLRAQINAAATQADLDAIDW